MHRLILVDDHHVILDGMAGLLKRAGHQVIATASSCASAREVIALHQEHTDIVMVDIQLPDGDGLELGKWAMGSFPHLKIVALSMVMDPEVVINFINAGGAGFISKADEFSQIISALESIAQGETWLSEPLSKIVFSRMARPRDGRPEIHAAMLTRREKEILTMIKEEKTIPEIAEELDIAESTVISHRKSLLSKLQARNTAGLINAIYTYRLLD